MYALYETATGRILCTLSALSRPAAAAAAAAGQAVLEVDAAVRDDTHYIRAGAAVAFPARPGPTHTWDWSLRRWRDARTLTAAKSQAWSRVRAARDAAEMGGYTWGGSRFDSDAVSQRRIQGAIQVATLQPAAFPLDWTLADNSVRALSALEMIEAGLALAAHVAAQHTTARALRAQIAAATTVAEADAIDWPP